MRRGGALVLLVIAACSRDAGTPAPSATGGDGADASIGAGPDAAVDAGACVITPYPDGPYGTAVGSIVQDHSWSGRAANGTAATVALSDARGSCATPSPVIVVRIGAEWCGTCRWHAGHARALLGSDVGARVRLVDVLVRDRENAPPDGDAAARWQAAQDTRTAVAIDPELSVADLLPASYALPYVLVVDARTMVLRDALAMPTEDALEASVRAALAVIDGTPVPAAPAPAVVDGRFTRDQWDQVTAFTMTDPPPPDPTDAVADSILAASFGGALFGELALSPSNSVACASCHEADRQLTDGSPTSPEGVGPVTRNAPSLTLASYQPRQFWDGRADSLWAQALAPIEASNEVGSSRLFVAHRVFELYRSRYEPLFGPMPALGDGARFPPSGQPGDPAWAAMAPADQAAVTRVFVNVGKSIEAFERTIRSVDSPIQAYARGDRSALTDAQKDGLLAFLQSGCAQCHWGPRMTDDTFHAMRFPAGKLNVVDRGRIDGIAAYAASEFGAGSPWSDDPSRARAPSVAGPWTLGAFKTPSLRNVALTAPYGHGGNYVQLAEVVELVRTGGLPASSTLAVGVTEPWVPAFDTARTGPIAAFLSVLAEPFAR